MRVALLAILVLFVTDCKKDDDEPTKSITGDWTGEFDLGGDTFNFIFSIDQDGSELNGNFEFDDGSGRADFDSDSEIDDKDVFISFTVPVDEGIMDFEFEGEVNNDFDEMDGDYTLTLTGYSPVTGSWEASKDSKKSAKGLATGKGFESLIKMIKQ